MLKDKPTVYTISPGPSFADSLAQGMIERAQAGEFELGECVLLLPNRRAARTLREAFLQLSGGRAVLPPRMQPVGDIDADEVSLLLAAEGEALDVPPAIDPLERQLLLARAIVQAGETAGMPQTFDHAAALALELGHFLDEVQTARLGFDGLKNLVPDAFAGHWQKTLEFLKILTEHWPAILKDRGVIDRAERRNLLIAAQIKAWTQHPPTHPVIVAGVTGTVPAVTDLMHLAARLPRGMAILPGLDRRMDDDSWTRISDDHPQFLFKTVIDHLGVSRADVAEWDVKDRPPANAARIRLLSEALRPAATSEKWRDLKEGDIGPGALKGFTRVDCDTPQEEADVIALMLRGALETPGRTAALVTPDRRLARRVALSLRRWDIGIDDSGGQPLTELPRGAWLMLTAEAAEEDLPPVPLLAMLKHPMMAAGLPPAALYDAVGLLDRLVLRGPRPSPGFAGLKNAIMALDERHAGSQKILLVFIDRLETRMKDFTALMSSPGEKPVRELLAAHIRMAESLAETEERSGADRLWRFEAGEAAADILGALLAAADTLPPLEPGHYVALLGSLLKSVTVRPLYGTHPRLSILGQVEARLFGADLVVLGGLNEGTWPALPPHDPWMSRPMRKEFGLPSPERVVGLAAHDFVHAAAGAEVVLTRARKVDGTPTVPARWLLRIETVLKAAGLSWDESEALRWRQWARQMDEAGPPRPAARPSPRPPVATRPRTLSVTQIERWIRDPYQIYAEKVLGLRKLDPVDADSGGADRGKFIHAALETFIKMFPATLPDDAVSRLLEFGRAAIGEMRVPREVEAFWWPRFEKIAEVFVEQEKDWRAQAAPFLTEARGEWTFDAPGGSFALKGRADRIDRFADGTYAVIDYKSGISPPDASVRRGLSPQLPLEALMLEKGGFPTAPPRPTTALVYWRVTGGGEKPVELSRVKPGEEGVAGLVRDAETQLKKMVDVFDMETTPYHSRPLAYAPPGYSDYDHLARVREWSAAGEDGDE